MSYLQVQRGFRFFNTENDATKEGKALVDAIIKHEYARIAEIEKTIQELEALDVTAPPKRESGKL